MDLIFKMETPESIIELYEKSNGERIKIIKYKNKQNIIKV